MPPPTDLNRWMHRKVEKRTPLPNGDQLLLLEAEKAYGGVSNLILVSKDGRALWEAELVQKSPYTAVKIEDEKLMAYSWAGYAAEIDMQTGVVISAVFTK